MGVSLLSSFTGAASQNMACFIAGTTILTATGLVEIEKLAAGDKVISTNPDTLETAEKTVLETYVRQVDKLVHITINGEKIVTTDNHPFYVQGRGFIEAGNLLLGDKLVSVNGEDLIVEDYHIELTEDFVSVYNFQVEDFHTYFVGNCAVWVHNDCKLPDNDSQLKHIFGDREGHLPDTPENRKLVIDLANDKSKYYGKDQWGNSWNIEIDANGNQNWVRYRNDIINNAGQNKSNAIRDWAPLTGLNNNPF